MRFRLTPRSMTLDDLELYKLEFSRNFSGFRSFRTFASRGFVSDSWACLLTREKTQRHSTLVNDTLEIGPIYSVCTVHITFIHFVIVDLNIVNDFRCRTVVYYSNLFS